MSKEAMTLALEALKYDADYDTSVTLQKAAIYALENAIADAEKQDPYTDVVSHWHYWMAEADKYRFALQNLEEALAKQEQGEPVAFITNHRQRMNVEIKPEAFVYMPTTTDWEVPLYTTPQPAQKPWVGLTNEEIVSLVNETNARIGTSFMMAFARTTEAKLKEKNT